MYTPQDIPKLIEALTRQIRASHMTNRLGKKPTKKQKAILQQKLDLRTYLQRKLDK